MTAREENTALTCLLWLSQLRVAVLAHSKEGMCTHIPGKVQERGCSLQGHLSRSQGHRARCGCTCPCRGAGSPHNPSSSAGTVSRHSLKEEVPSGKRVGKAEALPVGSTACGCQHPWLATPYRGKGRQQASLFFSNGEKLSKFSFQFSCKPQEKRGFFKTTAEFLACRLPLVTPRCSSTVEWQEQL